MKWFFSQSLFETPGCLVEFGIKYLIGTIIPGLLFSLGQLEPEDLLARGQVSEDHFDE